MKDRLLAFAGVLALLAVVGKFYAVPAVAQVRAAAVKNIDEKGRIPYTQFVTVDDCTNPLRPFSCDVLFPAVPAGKRVIVEHVNAVANVASGIVPVISLAAGSAGFYFPATAVRPKQFLVNEGILAYYEAGDVPWMVVSVDGVALSVRASLSGYMIDVTQ
jgi:hypothetical protein